MEIKKTSKIKEKSQIICDSKKGKEKPLLITCNRRQGRLMITRQKAFEICQEHNFELKTVFLKDWLFENHEIWEGCPNLFSQVPRNTNILIFNELPQYFDYNRLKYFISSPIIHFEDGEIISAIQPKYIFTSAFCPSMEVKGFIHHINF